MVIDEAANLFTLKDEVKKYLYLIFASIIYSEKIDEENKLLVIDEVLRLLEVDSKKIDMYHIYGDEFLIIKIFYEIFKDCSISYKYKIEALL